MATLLHAAGRHGNPATHAVEQTIGVDDAVWSHDETRIAVGRRTDGGWPLYRISSAGDDLVRLTEDDYNRVIPVASSSDDTKILAEGRLPGTIETRILIVGADGGGVTDITPFPGVISLPTSWLSK